ncbi:GFA family protein [Proteobacteria bacterium 005FR1]|nr:GFA family protein [Proteobacteria bacterium 005FR1]
MHKGSCLCGRVQYEYDGEIDQISRCYCSQCQKGQGTAFVAVAPVVADNLRFIRGQEYLKEFRATPGKARVFCSECGSPLYSARDDLPEITRLRLGTLDTKPQVHEQYHAYVAQKACWYEIQDEYHQYQGAPGQ